MHIDYWRKFEQTGSIRDYLNYRNSVLEKDKENGKSDNKGNWNSNKRDKDKRK